MKILHAAKYGAAVWCLVAASAHPATADELANCYRSNDGGFLLSNGNVVSKPDAVIDPAFKTHTLPPYPPEAQRHHERGIAILSVNIGADGAPADVAIARSSASQSLNDAAIEHIKTHWRWPSPVTACGQKTVQMYVSVIWNQMRWPALPGAEFHVKMPPSAYPPAAQEKPEGGVPSLLEIEIDEQGAVTAGRVIDSSGFPDLDEQALSVVKNSPALMKGQPSGKHVISADWGMRQGTLPQGETVIVTGRAMKP